MEANVTEVDSSSDEESFNAKSFGFNVDSPWTTWPYHFGDILGHKLPLKAPAKLRAATVCSGTDGPILALRHLLADCQLEHVYACDSCTSSRRFILKNFKPQNLYNALGACSLRPWSRAPCASMPAMRAHTQTLTYA